MKLLFLVIVLVFVPLASAQLKIGFYGSSCPQAESIVRNVVAKRFRADPTITAAFLRMYFHDCFPNGCDASLLIDPTPGNSSEKDAGPNRTVRGYDIIDAVKSAVESECPSTVSCADIIALATRDAVALAGGPVYKVPTGRRDGLVSSPGSVNVLPSPAEPIPDVLDAFAQKNFTSEEVVVLLGAHTVGFVHCFFLNLQDPSMDKQLRAKLTNVCTNQSATTFLDQSTPFAVDNKFYSTILANKGVLGLDRRLALDRTTAPIVRSLASDPKRFQSKFASVLVKMGNVEVLVGTEGEVRKKCRAFN